MRRVGRGSGLFFAVALALICCTAALAGKPQPVPPMHLTASYSWVCDFCGYPDSCYQEDDWHQEQYQGSLNGSISTSFLTCSTDVWSSGSGGLGVFTELQTQQPFVGDLAITGPDGTVRHAELVATWVSFTGPGSKKATTYDYKACVVHPQSLSTNVGTDPIASGLWTVTLTGDLPGNNWWMSEVKMAYVDVQQTECPADQQNLTP